MNGDAGVLDAARLRRDFDQAFARAEDPPQEPGEALLAVALAGEPYALRLDDLAFLCAGVEPAFLRTAAPPFLGLAGLRGEILPVWDLAVLLGYPAQGGSKPAWLACTAREPRWAAAFGRFDGLLRAPRGGIEPGGGGAGARFTLGVLRAGGLCRTVLDLDRISQAIREGSKP